jgi:hypothetical protein
MIACDVPGPVHLIEVGASKSTCGSEPRIPGRRPPVRDPVAPVQLAADRCGRAPARSGRVPRWRACSCRPQSARRTRPRRAPVARGAGVAREPPAARAASAALADAAADPPTVRAGDAIDVLLRHRPRAPTASRGWSFTPRPDARAHRPARCLRRRDRAAQRRRPLWRLSIEESPDPDPRPSPARLGAALLLCRPGGATETLAVVDGHLRWIEMLPPPLRT